MAKLSTNSKKNSGIVKLKIAVKKLQNSLLLGKNSSIYSETRDSSSNQVPEDVKEGHLAVVAVDGDEPKRFIVPLNYLNHPTFLRLLEQAAEEYGFDRVGAITVRCRPCVLERMLSSQEIISSGMK